jgi:hypothetical protein
MTKDGPTPPVADDDFPEFAEPPRHRPPVEPESQDEREADLEANEAQEQVDDVIARLRRERSEGSR